MQMHVNPQVWIIRVHVMSARQIPASADAQLHSWFAGALKCRVVQLLCFTRRGHRQRVFGLQILTPLSALDACKQVIAVFAVEHVYAL